MANIALKFFDPRAAKAAYGRKYTLMDRLIMLRSELVHVEVVFSGRYGYISFSATLRDGCWCCRFKYIKYSHPLQWRTVVVSMTNEEEDMAWQEACRMAGLPITWNTIQWDYGKGLEHNNCFYSRQAIPYDILGQGCHISVTLKWWKSNPKKTFCSKACARLIYIAKGVSDVWNIYAGRDEIMPSQLFNLAEGYFGPCQRDRL